MSYDEGVVHCMLTVFENPGHRPKVEKSPLML